MTDSLPRYRADALLDYTEALLQKAGLAASKAGAVARTLVEGDLLGHDTHGLALLPGYVKEIESGAMTHDGAPTVLSDRPAAVLWDGMRLPGPWLMEQGMDLLVPRARALGTASLVIRRSHHIACLAVYMLRALDEGMLMLLACSDPNAASVAPFGGTEAVFTPNPLAIGFPLTQTDGSAGVMVDISASITTNGMNNRKRAAGET
ncbi:MAG: Ldh family oxidoreductase, partial [Comamonadaceae bacterium]